MPNTPKPKLLAITCRGNHIENIHYGWICAYDIKKGIILKKGNIHDYTYLRSTAKPIQAIPLVKKERNITLKELAVICGSHSGSKHHISILKKLLRKYKINEKELLCGTHTPLDQKSNYELMRKNKKPTVLYNNCSGKHIGMLITCKKAGWKTKDYINPKHKLQQEIISYIKHLSGTKKINLATDGCSAPTFNMKIIDIAKLFTNFNTAEDPAFKKIIKAMTTYPFLSGGKGYIDTAIMKASRGKILAKVGAAGLIIAISNGKALVVKVADGSQHIRTLVTISLLKKLKWLSNKELESKELKTLTSLTIRNHRKLKVGKIKILNYTKPEK
ncbi:MAG: asparaginase [Candidatus Melainabacteria bacterium]|nr:asparaginase [Candidatus Melainabacteria bacterium]